MFPCFSCLWTPYCFMLPILYTLTYLDKLSQGIYLDIEFSKGRICCVKHKIFAVLTTLCRTVYIYYTKITKEHSKTNVGKTYKKRGWESHFPNRDGNNDDTGSKEIVWLIWLYAFCASVSDLVCRVFCFIVSGIGRNVRFYLYIVRYVIVFFFAVY